MPIYYRNKIYSEDEREKLWTNLLNKNERWVRGTKINISTLKGKKQYHNALLYQQKINKKLGYQDDTWKKENYVASLKMLENNLEH